MKNIQVKLGAIYRAKVSGNLVDLKVDKVRPRKYDGKFNGWFCLNLKTGRTVVVRSAARFKFEIPQPPEPQPTNWPPDFKSRAAGEREEE